MKANFAFFFRRWTLAFLVGVSPAARAQFNPAGSALDFNGANNYVSVSLASPPANNYTLTAWVYLHAGGIYGGSRVGVLSSATCGGSVELLIRSSTSNAADPQYVELGRCGNFNGFTNTIPVPLKAWTHVAVTLSSNNTVSYYVNGNPAGSFTDTNSTHNYALGASVILANNNSRRFNGILDEVQIWNRVLSPAEIWANRTRSLTGSENGLYAYYRFDEGPGSATTADSAAAGGGSIGNLINSPAWVSSGVMLQAPAQIIYAGVQTNLGAGWRTSSYRKPLDLDGDNVVGTDGYYLVNRAAVLPGYVGQASILTSTYAGNSSYASIDDPTNLPSFFVAGTMNPYPGKGTNANLFQFTLNTNAVGRTIRVGLLVDNLDNAAFNASSLSLLQLYGNEATSGPVATTGPLLNDRVPDWAFFDITGGADGDVFIIQGAGGTNNAATLGGVAFDSQPPTLVVTNLGDAGPGSLRATLAAASPGMTVAFATNLSGQTIYLTSGPLVPTSTVTIDASALPGGMTLSGGGTNQLVTVAADANLTLIGLTFAQGHAADTGGAIYSAPGSTLHIARCTFTANSGFEGGAILNDGTLFMENSTMTGNSAGYGGALQCRAPATLTHCTLTANNAPAGGGGIWNKWSTLTLNNSIIAGNTPATVGSDIYSESAALVLQNANMVQVATNDNPAGTTGPAPLTNAPLLAAFGNYGGPTKTMPPLVGSPAIDAGGHTALVVDQRGLPRAIGPAPDLGAAEYYLTNPSVTSTADDGSGSLRYDVSHTLPGTTNTVSFAPALSGQTILLTNGQIVLNGSLTLDASSAAGGIILNGNQNGTVFNVPAGAAASLRALTITNASNSGIVNAGSLSLSNCSVVGNVSTASGGGIYSLGSLTLSGCTVGGNRSTRSGGGIYASTSLSLTGCAVTGNIAGTNQNGGGIALPGSTIAFLTNCLISGNATTPGGGSGGGIVSFGTLNAYNCTLSSNSVPGGAGGGAIASVGPMQLIGCTLSGNSAPVQGGAIDNEWTCVLQNCTLSGNVSAYGGAILNNFDNSAQVTLSQCTLSGNSAWGQGSAIYNNRNTVNLTNSIVAGNSTPALGVADIYNNTGSLLNAGGTNLVQVVANHATVNGYSSMLAMAPVLAPLGNYGGPTQTMPPLGGSPAIDAGSDAAVTGLATDQRGYPRLAGTHVDIGAVEVPSGTIVTTVDDSGPGSLRGILAGTPGADLISFDPNLSGQTILLVSGPLTLNHSVAIDGSGLRNGITLNGNSNSPVLVVNGGVAATLNSLTLTNGYDVNGAFAGGIANAGNLTVNNCTVAGNGGADGAGGIYNAGTLALNTSAVTGNWALHGDGGGIYNDGTLVLNRSTLSGNSLAGGNGGGIWNVDTMVVNNSTLAGNTANYSGTGGSSSRAGHGGGIWSVGSLVLNNSTLATNSASLSGGGIEAFGGQAALTNSIVAGNSAPAAANISGTSVGLNNLTSGNPLLAPLGSYSGPTQTMPPLFGSPAIDTGSDAATNSLVTDQRGLPRLSGMHVDLGAVEFQTGRLVLTNSDSGENSLRAAAAYSSPGTTITFASNLSGGVINLTSGEIALNHDLTIDGSALANPVQINGNSNSAVFVVNSDVTATLRSLTVTNGYNNGYGGGLLTSGTLTLDRCSVLGNYATYGGGIFQSAGILVVSNCLVANNRSVDCGGIYTYVGATQFLWNSTVTGNSAADTGGGVKTYFGNIIIGNATIVGNAAANYGGGINNYGGSVALSNSIVAANNAPASTNLSGSFTGANNLTNGNPLLAPLGYYGGPTQTMPPLAGSPAVDAGSDVVTSFLATDQRGLPRLSGTHVDIGAVEFQQGLVVTTTADSGEHSLRAAVAYSPSGSTVTFNPGLAGQTILLTGGQLELGKNLTIDGSALSGGITINGNHAGRIFQVDGGVTVVLNSLTITNGTDTGGGNAGGGGILSYGSLTLDNCTLAGNSANQASWGGGGILSYRGTLTVNQSTLSGNSANNSTRGGGIVTYGGTLTVNQSTLTGNSANGGGGIFNGGGMTMNNSIVAGNSPDNIFGSFAGANNLTGGNPLLAPLANYGGPTATMPPLPGSPAIDAGGPSTFTTDQRGLPRLSGQHVDLGAVEVQIASSAPALTGASWLNLGTPPVPAFQFGFSSLSYGSFTVFATTNAGSPFNTWSNLGPAIETPLGSGQFQFNDPQAANSPQRYYRVRSP